MNWRIFTRKEKQPKPKPDAWDYIMQEVDEDDRGNRARARLLIEVAKRQVKLHQDLQDLTEAFNQQRK